MNALKVVCEHRPRRLAASHSQSDCTLPQLRRMRSPAFCTAHRLHLCKTTSDHLESAARCRLHSPAIHRRRPISSRHDDWFRRLRPCTRLRRTAANSGGFNRSATATVGLWPLAGVRERPVRRRPIELWVRAHSTIWSSAAIPFDRHWFRPGLCMV